MHIKEGLIIFFHEVMTKRGSETEAKKSFSDGGKDYQAIFPPFFPPLLTQWHETWERKETFFSYRVQKEKRTFFPFLSPSFFSRGEGGFSNRFLGQGFPGAQSAKRFFFFTKHYPVHTRKPELNRENIYNAWERSRGHSLLIYGTVDIG